MPWVDGVHTLHGVHEADGVHGIRAGVVGVNGVRVYATDTSYKWF